MSPKPPAVATADGYDARLRAACLKLADFPNRGTPHDDLAPGLRSVAFERRATLYIARFMIASKSSG